MDRGELSRKAGVKSFCYTGSVSVHAALGGAKEVVSVDMSNTYLNWAMDNFQLNHLPIKQHQFVRADCQRWLDAASGTFDVIFLDPPTFSNSKRRWRGTWTFSGTIALIRSCARLLSPGGVLIFSNNLRKFELDEHAITELGLKVENITAQTIDQISNALWGSTTAGGLPASRFDCLFR